jgi:hypothetical protein
VVTGILRLPTRPPEEEYKDQKGTQTDCNAPGDGHLDLGWNRERDTRIRCYTRFIVSEEYDSPFDALLGRKDMVQYDTAISRIPGPTR